MPTKGMFNQKIIKRLKFVWAFFALFYFSGNAQAQIIDFVPFSESKKEESKWVLYGDTRNSFLQNRTLKIRGVKVGKEWDETWQMGLGFHWADISDIRKQSQSALRGFSGFLAYSFNYRRFNYKIPLQLNLSSWNEGRNETLVSYEAAMLISKTYWRVVTLGIGMGYRVKLYSSVLKLGGATAPVYLLKVGLELGYIAEKLGLKR
ncbi:MAG: hypothetical protein ACI9YL_000816 [Luteibaculaceae bacterium]|jgi:hypothetical protein